MQPAAAAGRVCPLYVVSEGRPGPDGRARAWQVVDALMEVADHFARKPALGDVVRVSATCLGRTLLELRPLSSPATWRRADLELSPKGSPAYGSVFAELDSWLRRDRRVLERRGQEVLRPVVLLLVQQGPARPDTWRPDWERLQEMPSAPIITALCGPGTAEDFADAVVHPTGESRAYQAVEDFGTATSMLITQISQRLLDAGVAGAPVVDLLPGTTDLGGVAVVRGSSGPLEPPPLPALRPAEPAAGAVPDTFFFDRRLATFVTGGGADIVELPRRDVERAVVGLLDGNPR